MREPLAAVDDLRPLRPLQAIDAAVERAGPQQSPDAGPPLLDVRRRREHGVGARRERAHPLPPQIVQRVQDRGNEMRADVGLQAVNQIGPARGRHAIVDQHDVGRVKQRLLEGALPVGHGADVDSFTAQEPDQRAHDRAARRDDETLDLPRRRQLFVCCSLVGEHSIAKPEIA